MSNTIYAESTLMHRPIQNDELSQFRKVQHFRRKKKYVYNYRKHLFSSNFRPHIVMTNGIETQVEKGSRSEDMFWNVKDLVRCPGNSYYFDTPEEAERIFKISYSNDLKTDWYERTTQYRDCNDDDEDDVNDITIVR